MTGPSGPARISLRMLLYHFLSEVRVFGAELEPRYIFGADSLDQ
jgi:hypothetical protein